MEVSSSCLQKMSNLYFLPQKNHGYTFFPQGWSYRTNCLKHQERARFTSPLEIKISTLLSYRTKRTGGQQTWVRSKFRDSHLFSKVERFQNYTEK